MEFNYQFDEFSESFFCGRDYCLLGNGYLRLVVQLKNNFGSSGNAILLNLISSDEYRARRFLLLAHHAFKEMPSCVAVRHEGQFYVADSRQIGTDSLNYELAFDGGVPSLVVRWKARYQLSRDTTPRITDEQIEDVALAPGNIGLAAKGPVRRGASLATVGHGEALAPRGISGVDPRGERPECRGPFHFGHRGLALPGAKQVVPSECSITVQAPGRCKRLLGRGAPVPRGCRTGPGGASRRGRVPRCSRPCGPSAARTGGPAVGEPVHGTAPGRRASRCRRWLPAPFIRLDSPLPMERPRRRWQPQCAVFEWTRRPP